MGGGAWGREKAGSSGNTVEEVTVYIEVNVSISIFFYSKKISIIFYLVNIYSN